MIFQLQDDHSRLAVAWLVARAETSDAAVRVFDKGVRAYGVPQRPPDRQRGLVEPHPQGPAGPAGGSRQSAGRGAHHRQALQAHHPRRRNERFHSTLLRWLDKQPLAATVAEPPGTGQAPSTASTRHRASPPEPARARYPRPGMGRHRGGPGPQTAARRPARPTGQTTQGPAPTRPGRRSAPTATRRTTIGRNGTISLAGTAYLVSRSRAGQEALITWDAHRITITDPHGEVLTQYPWPQPGTRYVSHHDPATRATRGGRPRKTPRNVTDVLTHQPSPMS